MNGRYVPDIWELKDLIMGEAHNGSYLVHLGRDKMTHDLKETISEKG